MPQVFSGIQPTGTIHIGNYIGAIQNWVKIQDTYPNSIFCVVNYHAMTISYDIHKMQETIYRTAYTLLACGLDPKKCILFVQSAVPQHTELNWILTTVTPYGDLTRMTQFKDKSQQNQDNINAGLFSYPVLMAADILLYRADIIPVGEDQLQHLELTREIARRFNAVYGNIFPEPKGLLTETPKILGLDGKYKMSKSLNNYISLEETEDSLWDKLRGAKTDEARIRRTDKGNPQNCNIFTLHRQFSTSSECQQIDTDCRNAGIGCVDCKKILNRNLLNFLAPIQEKIRYYQSHLDDVKDILTQGKEKCIQIAEKTMVQVKKAIGMPDF